MDTVHVQVFIDELISTKFIDYTSPSFIKMPFKALRDQLTLITLTQPDMFQNTFSFARFEKLNKQGYTNKVVIPFQR